MTKCELAQLVIDTLTPILRGSAKRTVDHYAEELERLLEAARKAGGKE